MGKRSVGSLFIDIEARTARLEADLAKTRGLLQRLNAQVNVIGKGFSSAFGLAKGAVAAFASVQMIRSVEAMAMGSLEAMRAQIQLAEATSLSVNDIKAYEEASEHLGVTNLNLAKTMKELFTLQSDVRGGNKEATKQIQQMGLSVEQFASLGPAELFESVVGGLSKISNVSQRAALSQKVFGKEASNLSTLLTNGTAAIAEARKEMVRLNQTMEDGDSARIQVALGAVAELSDRWEVFKRKMAIGLTPLIYEASTRLADLLANIDVESLAKKISGWVMMIGGFIITIPERLKVMIAEVKLMWYDFIASMPINGGLLGQIFGTSDENKAKADEIRAEVASLKASIVAVSSSMETEFNSKVQAMLNKILQVPTYTNNATTAISSGMKEMVEQFSSSFQRLADFSDQFLDGESIKFGDWFREIVKTMVKTFLKVSLINPLLNSVFGGMMGGTSAGWWSNLPSIFGKARGGPVMAGDTHLFGEKGPEIGTVARSGYITPNERMRNLTSGDSSGGPSIVIQQHFSSGLQRAELAAIIPQIVNQSKAAVSDAMLRGGGFRKAMRT